MYLIIIVFFPSFLNSLIQPTAHESNSTELPIQYTPEPNIITAPPTHIVKHIKNYNHMQVTCPSNQVTYSSHAHCILIKCTCTYVTWKV